MATAVPVLDLAGLSGRLRATCAGQAAPDATLSGTSASSVRGAMLADTPRGSTHSSSRARTPSVSSAMPGRSSLGGYSRGGTPMQHKLAELSAPSPQVTPRVAPGSTPQQAASSSRQMMRGTSRSLQVPIPGSGGSGGSLTASNACNRAVPLPTSGGSLTAVNAGNRAGHVRVPSTSGSAAQSTRPSASPLTDRPSASPFTERPSASPFAGRPSASPLADRPSASPFTDRPSTSPFTDRANSTQGTSLANGLGAGQRVSKGQATNAGARSSPFEAAGRASPFEARVLSSATLVPQPRSSQSGLLGNRGRVLGPAQSLHTAQATPQALQASHSRASAQVASASSAPISSHSSGLAPGTKAASTTAPVAVPRLALDQDNLGLTRRSGFPDQSRNSPREDSVPGSARRSQTLSLCESAVGSTTVDVTPEMLNSSSAQDAVNQAVAKQLSPRPRVSPSQERACSPQRNPGVGHVGAGMRAQSPEGKLISSDRPMRLTSEGALLPSTKGGSAGTGTGASPRKTAASSAAASPMTGVRHSNGLYEVSARQTPQLSTAEHPHTEHTVVELQKGATVQIGSRVFEVDYPIGEGTFGIVWGARCTQGGGSVAIKEICCRSEAQAINAAYEAQVLQELGSSSASRGVAEVKGADRIPALVSHSTECVGPEEWRVRLAMTQIPGESLNRFLERRKAKESESKEPLSYLYKRYSEACHFARALLSQLAPAFARISALAYHRDVNPRNILIDVSRGSSSNPRYGLIDFGLAVDATRWRLEKRDTPDGEAIGAWQVLGVGGDCRYWTVSAWLMLEQGPRALSSSPQLCLEYKTHLDLHALGITALQVFVELLPPPRDDLQQSSSASPEELEAMRTLQALQAAWERYWERVTRYWRRLFEAYRRGGDGNDLAAVKAEYRQHAVHDQVAAQLRDLRLALSNACEACLRVPPEVGLQGVPPVLSALLAMVGSGEDKTDRSSWQRIELLVECRDGGECADFEGSLETLRSPRKQAAGWVSPLPVMPAAPSSPRKPSVATTMTVSTGSGASSASSQSTASPLSGSVAPSPPPNGLRGPAPATAPAAPQMLAAMAAAAAPADMRLMEIMPPRAVWT